jgi:hypothetical protein
LVLLEEAKARRNYDLCFDLKTRTTYLPKKMAPFTLSQTSIALGDVAGKSPHDEC